MTNENKYFSFHDFEVLLREMHACNKIPKISSAPLKMKWMQRRKRKAARIFWWTSLQKYNKNNKSKNNIIKNAQRGSEWYKTFISKKCCVYWKYDLRIFFSREPQPWGGQSYRIFWGQLWGGHVFWHLSTSPPPTKNIVYFSPSYLWATNVIVIRLEMHDKTFGVPDLFRFFIEIIADSISTFLVSWT